MVIALMVEGDAPGGTERLVIQMAVDFTRRGHRVVVVGPRTGPGKGWLGSEVRSRGLDYATVPQRIMLDPRAVLDIARVIRRYGVDVVHSHEFAPSVFGAIASRLLGRRHVLTMHGNLYFANAWRRRQAFRWAARNSAAVVGVSRATADDAERLLDLPPGSVHAIPNGIAPQPGQRDRLRVELGLADDDLLVAALGNVSPRKAHAVILRSLIALRERRPDVRWHFAIAGNDQGCAQELRDIASSAGVQSRFHLLGHRSDTDDVLAASDVFAMSSLHEGMPLAIMEAMFASRPIISTTAGGVGEMITDGVDGLLVPVGDETAMSAGLERLLSDASLRERLANAARPRAERQFGIAPMAEAYLRLYGVGA